MKEKGKKGFLGSEPIFKESLKIAVAREYLTGQLSFSQLAKKHGLPAGDTVRWFVKWYKNWLKQIEPEPGESPPVVSDHALDLERQLKEANLRITALEMLIKNAEKELGINIVKKSGTKQRDK